VALQSDSTPAVVKITVVFVVTSCSLVQVADRKALPQEFTSYSDE
jgi:hypothetical protein